MEKTKFTKQDFIDYCNAHPDEVNKILNDKRSVDEGEKSFVHCEGCVIPNRCRKNNKCTDEGVNK